MVIFSENASGLLLHPSVGDMVNEAVVIRTMRSDLPPLIWERRQRNTGTAFTGSGMTSATPQFVWL